MIIAQGAANDDPRVYMHAAMHENPADQSYSKDPLLQERRKMPTISPFLSLILASPCMLYIKV